MNCNEVKNLIRECEDVRQVNNDPKIASHLSECKACAAYLAYELTLRKGFESIIEEPVPSELTNSILQIPVHNRSKPKWPGKIIQTLQSFHIKTAFASCVAGFLAALFFFADKNIAPVKKNTMQHTEVSEPAVIPALEEQKGFDSDSEGAYRGVPLLSTKQFSRKPQALDPLKDEQIPGAVSFSIAEEPELRFDQKTRKNQSPKLVSAPQISLALKKESAAPEDRFVAFRAADSQQIERKKAPDSRIKELEDILSLYASSLKTGIVNISDLQARGIIPAEKHEYFLPPPGMTWKIIKGEQGLKVELVKE